MAKKSASKTKNRKGSTSTRGPSSSSSSSSSTKQNASWQNLNWRTLQVLVLCLLVVLLAVIYEKIEGQTQEEQKVGLSPLTTTTVPRSRSEPLPLLDLLFPFQTLDDAWEEYPLLSTVYDDDRPIYTQNKVHNVNGEYQGIRIPTVYHPQNAQEDSLAEKQLHSKLHLIQNLIQSQDYLDIILHPKKTLQHGTDYYLKKLVVRDDIDGQEWPDSPAVIPKTAAQFQNTIHEDGYSLIIDNMQRRWKTVKDVNRQLQRETRSTFGSVNLYLTPPPRPTTTAAKAKSKKRQSGFESHWDWMDVLVMQIEGTKLWSVTNTPHTQLSCQDQQYKPSPKDNENYANHRYEEFLLRPGDVLYIPRGYMHNASTITTDNNTTDTTSNSLHLTFGIEHECQSTVEALVHHAIEIYAASMGNDNVIVTNDSRCGDNIAWKDLLHMVVAEVARRDRICNNDDDDLPAAFLSSCTLRRSVPRNQAFVQIANMKRQQHAERDNKDSNDDDHNQLIHSLLKEAFETILQYADLQQTKQFLHRLEGRVDALSSNMDTFCHPFSASTTTIPVRCLEGVDPTALSNYIQNVQDLMLQHPQFILQQFNDHLNAIQKFSWEREDSDLLS